MDSNERQNTLTWEDINAIISIDQQVCAEWGISKYTHKHREAMEEILKRFNDNR